MTSMGDARFWLEVNIRQAKAGSSHETFQKGGANASFVIIGPALKRHWQPSPRGRGTVANLLRHYAQWEFPHVRVGEPVQTLGTPQARGELLNVCHVSGRTEQGVVRV